MDALRSRPCVPGKVTENVNAGTPSSSRMSVNFIKLTVRRGSP
uniref:Uncharacterized protein n=1 Tax=Anguilla anguilla TaxID=7936 RepID=A0A0E9W423_ANGAN